MTAENPSGALTAERLVELAEWVERQGWGAIVTEFPDIARALRCHAKALRYVRTENWDGDIGEITEEVRALLADEPVSERVERACKP